MTEAARGAMFHKFWAMGTDEEIEAKAKDLTEAAMKMGQSIYEAEQANASAGDADAASADTAEKDDDVVDAEFSEVDEDSKA